jgi:hypothetical protein
MTSIMFVVSAGVLLLLLLLALESATLGRDPLPALWLGFCSAAFFVVVLPFTSGFALRLRPRSRRSTTELVWLSLVWILSLGWVVLCAWVLANFQMTRLF